MKLFYRYMSQTNFQGSAYTSNIFLPVNRVYFLHSTFKVALWHGQLQVDISVWQPYEILQFFKYLCIVKFSFKSRTHKMTRSILTWKTKKAFVEKNDPNKKCTDLRLCNSQNIALAWNVYGWKMPNSTVHQQLLFDLDLYLTCWQESRCHCSCHEKIFCFYQWQCALKVMFCTVMFCKIACASGKN